MSGGSWISLGLAFVGAIFVLWPLRQRARTSHDLAAESLSSSRDLQSQQEMLLTSLRDLEDDHATDKISDADYAELRARLSGEAIEVMRKLDTAEEQRAADAASRTVPYPGTRRPARPR